MVDIVLVLFKIYSKQWPDPQATCIEKLKNTPCEIELQKHHSLWCLGSFSATDVEQNAIMDFFQGIFHNISDSNTLEASQLPSHKKNMVHNLFIRTFIF